MPAPISILIPTLDAAGDLGPVLAALTEGLGAGLVHELILSDGGSRDDIAELADAAGAVLLTGPAGRGGQLRRAAEAARAPWLLVVHADSVPAPGWSQAVMAHLSAHPDKAGYFDLSFDQPGLAGRLTAGWANLRARLFGLPYGDQGLLVRRTLHDRVGGYPDIPLMEDVAIARRLRGTLRPLGHRIVTSAARYRRDGWLRRGARNLGTLTLYLLGRDPQKLAARYRR